MATSFNLPFGTMLSRRVRRKNELAQLRGSRLWKSISLDPAQGGDFAETGTPK